jgi:hypothetical protein
MANLQDKLIENLANFTLALENIVEILQEQAKKNPADVVNKLSESINSENLIKIAQSLESIKKDTSNINNKTDEILRLQKDAKKAKETGLFGKIQDKDNKNKIIDGVKVITLIAGGVLAIGAAFNIVGKVDYGSVLALGASIVAMSYAFKTLSDIKMNAKQYLTACGALVVMSAAIFASAEILKYLTPLNIQQLITIGAITIALSFAAFFLIKSIEHIKLNAKTIAMIGLMPLILPIISISILLSSLILKNVVPLSMKDAIALGATSLAIAISVSAFVPAIYAMGKINMENLLSAVIAIPLIAGAIVITSLILDAGKYGATPPLKWTLNAGLPLVIFSIVAYGMGKLDTEQMVQGVVGILLVAGAIVATAYILNAGKYGATPPLIWSLKAGLSIAEFGLITVGLGFVINKIGFGSLLEGILAVPLIAGIIVLSSIILNLGKYGSTPSLAWTIGAGLSIATFGLITLGLGLVIFASGGIGFAALALGALSVLIIAATVVAASYILGTGKYGIFPSKDWSEGVGISLGAFGISALALGTVILGSFGLGALALVAGLGSVLLISDAIVKASIILGKGKYGIFPSKDWAEGVGGSIYMFAKSLAIITAIEGIGSIFGKKINFNEFITNIANAMNAASETLSKGKWDNKSFPSKDWAEGVGESILAFAKSFAIVSGIEGIFSIFGKKVNFIEFINNTVSAMNAASIKLSEGKWDNKSFPSKDWAEGVGGSILAFAQTMQLLDKIGLDGKEFQSKTILIANSMNAASKIISGGIYGTFPSTDFSKSISDFISAIPEKDKTKDISKFINTLNDFSDIKGSTIDNIVRLSNAVNALAVSLSKLNTDNLNSLFGMTSSILTISVIDQKQLEKVLQVIKNKSTELKQTTGTSAGFMTKLRDTMQDKNTVNNKSNVVISQTSSQKEQGKNTDMIQLLGFVKNIDDNLQTIVDTKKVEDAPEKGKDVNAKK